MCGGCTQPQQASPTRVGTLLGTHTLAAMARPRASYPGAQVYAGRQSLAAGSEMRSFQRLKVASTARARAHCAKRTGSQRKRSEVGSMASLGSQHQESKWTSWSPRTPMEQLPPVARLGLEGWSDRCPIGDVGSLGNTWCSVARPAPPPSDHHRSYHVPPLLCGVVLWVGCGGEGVALVQVAGLA